MINFTLPPQSLDSKPKIFFDLLIWPENSDPNNLNSLPQETMAVAHLELDVLPDSQDIIKCGFSLHLQHKGFIIGMLQFNYSKKSPNPDLLLTPSSKKNRSNSEIPVDYKYFSKEYKLKLQRINQLHQLAKRYRSVSSIETSPITSVLKLPKINHSSSSSELKLK